MVFWILTIYCLLILLASLAGGWIPLVVKLTHTRLQLASSFIAGLMLGVGLLHLLPHAWSELRSVEVCMRWLLAGFLTSFFIQRFLHHHHHDVPAVGDSEHQAHAGHHGHHGGHGDEVHFKHKWSWASASVGLALHTVINGIALAAAVEADVTLDKKTALVGLGTFLVIFLHKPFDALTIGTLMAAGGWSKKSRHLVNVLFSLTIPLGAALFYVGIRQFLVAEHEFLGAALAFVAGTFLCIAAIDLLPELQFHKHDRIKLSLALLLGLALAVVIGVFEGHEHHHEPSETGQKVETGHDHDH